MQGDFRVDGYDIEGLLGAGPAGEVWLAREQASGTQAALKRVRPRDLAAQEEAGRIVSALESLDHPHVLRIREMLPYEREVVFVLDYAEGGSLGQLLLARPALDPGEVVTMATAMADALQAVHRRGVVHGDVTPENVLFTADARPLLADAGLLRLVEGGEAGTVGYSDPAGSDGTPPTPAGDVYGLAAVCYTALTGTPPEPGLRRRPLHQVAPGVPPALAHIVEAGLQAHPAQRPAMADLGAQLAAACPSVPVRFPSGLGADDSLPFGPNPGPGTGADFGIGAGPAPGRASGSRPGSGRAGEPAAERGGREDPARGSETGRRTDAPAPPDFPSALGDFAANAVGATTDPDSAEHEPTGRSWRPRRSGRSGRSGRVEAADSEDAEDGGDAGEPEDAEDDGSSDRARRLLMLGGIPLLLVVVAVSGVLGWRAVREPGPDPTSTSTPTSAPTSTPTPTRASAMSPAEARWAKVLDELDLRRARAWKEWNRGLLEQVYTPGSSPMSQDLADMQTYAQQGVTSVDGLRTPILSLHVVSQSSDRVVVDAESQLRPYRVRIDGNYYPHDGKPPKRFRITLERSDSGGWLIAASKEIAGTTPAEPAR
ncbi:serine/threonine protein kinase [Actinopolymorpha singaporensis]|uniref:non-specific serine/threonine protein kinase n=1 Tax=Actinopolymorpha singaporensis TaxID=117157 RepID=A0A1H1XE44_9ACTN|nr:serine/threonine-protein kinase [Actinopolymorpha singaporensis]SDT07573.1 Serine/threonine protein kinase [Actinopolymorpha singaporensis]